MPSRGMQVTLNNTLKKALSPDSEYTTEQLIEVVRILVRAGASINAQPEDVILTYCSEPPSLTDAEEIALVTCNGAEGVQTEKEFLDQIAISPLCCAISREVDSMVIKTLLELQADPKYGDGTNSAINTAQKYGRQDIVELLQSAVNLAGSDSSGAAASDSAVAASAD